VNKKQKILLKKYKKVFPRQIYNHGIIKFDAYRKTSYLYPDQFVNNYFDLRCSFNLYMNHFREKYPKIYTEEFHINNVNYFFKMNKKRFSDLNLPNYTINIYKKFENKHNFNFDKKILLLKTHIVAKHFYNSNKEKILYNYEGKTYIINEPYYDTYENMLINYIYCLNFLPKYSDLYEYCLLNNKYKVIEQINEKIIPPPLPLKPIIQKPDEKEIIVHDKYPTKYFYLNLVENLKRNINKNKIKPYFLKSQKKIKKIY